MLENEILNVAIDAIYKETGLEIVVLKREFVLNGNKRVDALLQIPGKNIQLLAEVKKWTNHINVGAVVNQLNQLGETKETILVGDYINPKMAEKLKEANIQHMDGVGNVFINQMPLYIYIKGNKGNKNIVKKQHTKTGRAFQQTGLKVIFEFLKDRELINAPYRKIADEAKVALGNIGWVFGDLENQGFVRKGAKGKNREIVDYEKLFDKWVEEYPYKLKTKLRLGEFTTTDPNWWKKIDPAKMGVLWGGEIAAAKYTNYLNPKDAVVYLTKEKLNEFIKQGRLKKINNQGKEGVRIDIIERFWNAGQREMEQGLVNPIITYADLVETGEPRNLETANRLREQFIH